MQIRLGECNDIRLDRRSRVGVGCTLIPQDRRIEPIVEGSRVSVVGFSTNPVVGDRLIGIEDERVPLAGEDVDGVHSVGLSGFPVGFDDCEIMSIDGEVKVRIAGHSDESEAIALALLDIDN